jgi:hypothetical protein
VPSEFLPPDPYADTPSESGPPVFAPPGAPPGRRESHHAVLALAAGAAALGLLALSTGAAFFLTLPASIAGWVLGLRAKRIEGGRDQGNVAVIMGIVGTILGVAAGAIWIAIWT